MREARGVLEKRERKTEEDRMLLSPPVRKVAPSEYCCNTSSEHTKEGAVEQSKRCTPVDVSRFVFCPQRVFYSTSTSHPNGARLWISRLCRRSPTPEAM